jgi:V8-like Glu-specific endopeptidase
MRLAFFGLFFLALIGTMGAAQDLQASLNAVGRISYGTPDPKGEAAVCSGTLVAPTLVLTADHCLRGHHLNPETVYFTTTRESMALGAVGRGLEILFLNPQDQKPAFADDIALLRLSAPMPLVVPIHARVAQDDAASYTLIGYARQNSNVQSRTDDCFAIPGTGDVLGLSCPAVSGNSGAPVLIADPDGWRIVGVMVASARGLPASLAARISPDVIALMDGAP